MLTLDHVVMPVRDAEATLKFYTQVLELPLIAAHGGDDWDGYPWLMMVFGLSGKHELVFVALSGAPVPDYRGVPVDARHYAMAADSAEAFEAWKHRLTGAGVTYWEENHGDQASIYFPDPDNVILEITWPASRVLKTPVAGAYATVQQWLKASEPA